MKRTIPSIASRSINTFGFLMILFIVSCSNSNQKEGRNTDVVEDIPAKIRELTVQWNDNLVKQDLQSLAILYADNVSVYGSSASNGKLIDGKEKFFKKYPDFNQSITGDIMVEKITGDEYKAIFPKRSTFNGKTATVQGYLIFNNVSGTWKITKESDDVTDKNKSTQGDIKLSSCIDVVEKILVTSPVYLEAVNGLKEEIIKNGGTSYFIKLAGSPNPKRDGAEGRSENYDFTLNENYPDHSPVIANFTFDPEKRQLFQYDFVEDILTPVDFDKRLLLKFDELCK